MDVAGFERAWRELDFRERAEILKIAIAEFCKEEGGQPVIVHVREEQGYMAKTKDGERPTTGDTILYDDRPREVTIFGLSPGLNHPGNVIDNPWESLTAGFHEVIHSVMPDGGEKFDDTAHRLIEDYAHLKMQDFQRDIERHARELGLDEWSHPPRLIEPQPGVDERFRDEPGIHRPDHTGGGPPQPDPSPDLPGPHLPHQLKPYHEEGSPTSPANLAWPDQGQQHHPPENPTADLPPGGGPPSPF